MTIKRALLSVYDKTGIAAFARELHGLGIELLASGGTARALAEERIPVTPVEEYGPDSARFRALATLDPDGHRVLVASIDGPTSYDGAKEAS